MLLRVEIVMHGYTAASTVSDVDAHAFLDAVRAAWASNTITMLTITDARPGAYPMHINSANVQIVTLSEDLSWSEKVA